MTNYEKNKAVLDMYAIANVSWGVDKDEKIFDCNRNICTYCIFYGKGICTQKRLEWLQQEYKESELKVDWNKVLIDTPILVSDYEDAEWNKRYFAGYIGGKVCTFDDGYKSEHFIGIKPWNYAKLAEQEDEA